MLNYTINGLIRTQRPGFGLDAELHWSQLLTFVRIHFIAWLRGFKLLMYGFLPGKALLGRGVRLQYSRYIQLGQWIRLEDQVLLSGLGRGPIWIGHRSRIGAYSRLITATSPGQLGSHIHIGDNVGIGEYSYLGGAGGLTIGDNCIIGQYFSCHPENHNYTDPSQLIRLQGVTRRGIHIGENCWIGAKVTILDGVHIGAGSVIAAGAVVTKNVPPQSVVGGVPARLLNSIS